MSLLTALPIVWGEGDAADVVAGRTHRSATLVALDQAFVLRAIDTITPETLGSDVAILAQPRRLTGVELVALDDWIRRGGRVLIFADPELAWPSQYAPGDPRRPPPVTLLDPLFVHWGVTLGDSDRIARVSSVGRLRVATFASGSWRGPQQCTARGPLVLDCTIGRGRAILVGDADILDERLWQSTGADNPAWIESLVRDVSNRRRVVSNGMALLGIVAALLIGVAISWSSYRRFGRT